MRFVRFSAGIGIGMAMGIAMPLLAQAFIVAYGNVGVRFQTSATVFCVDQAGASVLAGSTPQYTLKNDSFLGISYRSLTVTC